MAAFNGGRMAEEERRKQTGSDLTSGVDSSRARGLCSGLSFFQGGVRGRLLVLFTS